MQAITTKYFGPSNVKGSRIKATAQAGSLTVSKDDSLNYEDAHLAAAKAFAQKLGWHGSWVGGFNHHGEGVWVCVDDRFGSAFTIEKPE